MDKASDFYLTGFICFLTILVRDKQSYQIDIIEMLSRVNVIAMGRRDLWGKEGSQMIALNGESFKFHCSAYSMRIEAVCICRARTMKWKIEYV